MRLVFITLFICAFGRTSAQVEFGRLTPTEKIFTTYKKDTTAAAVYLYEYGNNYFELRNNYIWLITKYHAKIKVLKREGFEQGNIEIPLYKGENRSEKIVTIKAITHNSNTRHVVSKEKFYDVDLNDKWKETRFTFSDIRVGSVLEYEYEIQSPFYFNLNDWDFQRSIPKVYTEFHAEIPGNWNYHRVLVGQLPLYVNEAKLKLGCFHIPGFAKSADCEVLKYIMRDVPSFNEEESFMLSGDNYRSRLKFELAEYQNFNGLVEKFSKSWRDVDKEFKKDQDIGRQLKKKNFFEKLVPVDLTKSKDPLVRAKNIYEFVQQHYNWNNKYGLWNNNKVKKAFEERKGNVFEINSTLINLLNASDIKADMALLSTRSKGLPTQSYPVMTDFNYMVVRAEIDNEVYFLDATDKLMPFGMLPFKCLNHLARIMDFEDESYWESIVPEQKNKNIVRVKMELNPDQNNATGSFMWNNMGYDYLSRKGEITQKSENEILEELENGFGDNLNINSYEVSKTLSGFKKLSERFEFDIENIQQGNSIYLNPFLVKFMKENPFKSRERNFPIDFGYPRSNSYMLDLKIPEGYKVKSLPEKLLLALPNNEGFLRFECKETSFGSINVFFDFKINSVQFVPNVYSAIQEFFQNAVEAQTNSFISLEKV